MPQLTQHKRPRLHRQGRFDVLECSHQSSDEAEYEANT
jgi:hypothetical protein